MANNISLKCIYDLLDYHFIIPSYQRGYRWTGQQVNDLLDDIWEFTLKDKNNKNEFYCLQPVIVARKGNGYSIIDGQQRLTTIYIILSVLKDATKHFTEKYFTLEYETRKGSEAFLQNIDLTRKDENIDYYHICRAIETVDKWFKDKPKPAGVNFLKSLLNDNASGNNVKVIWYEIGTNVNLIDIFTRINSGKIPLTNAELVKALFLRKDNFNGDQNILACRLRQFEMAAEWDNIEYKLWNNDFWYFLTNSKPNLDNRIEFIFDLIANKSTSDRFFTFRYFNEQLTESGNVENIWSEIKKYFFTFSEWFNDREYYHLVGYLITLNEKIKDLKSNSVNQAKSEFKKYLLYNIKEHTNCRIAELTYEGDKDKIRNILLLFNIISLLSNSNSNARFQFDRFKTEKWDIEHIHSIQSEMPLTTNYQEDWLNEVFNFTKNEDLKTKISAYWDAKPNEREFGTIYDQVLAVYNEPGNNEDIDDISNLTLLNSGTNRGYKNAIFPIKRNKIIEKDRNDTFIPLCTKNVFLKYYSDSVDQMTFWGKSDRKAYLEAINYVISVCFKWRKRSRQ